MAISLALAAPSVAFAGGGAQPDHDNDGEARMLDRVIVNAYRTTTHTQGATKTDTPVAETAQSISVIAREELDARGVQTLNEAMRYVAGVTLESTGIDNRVDDFSIRGFDAGSWGNNVTLDGMRAPQGAQFNRTMFDNWNLERVEVLKGPSAVMYGQVAPGGMVNQVSKTPEPDQRQVLRLGLDGHGQYQAAFDVGGGNADNRHLFRLVGLYRDGRTQIDETRQRRWFIAPSYTLQIARKTRLTLLGMHQRDEGGATYQFLPMHGTLIPTRYGRMKNTTFIGEPNWNVYDRTVWTAGWLFEHAFNENWTLSQSVRHTRTDSLYRTVVTKGPLNTDGRTQERRAIWATGDSTGQTVDTRIQGRFRTGALTHVLLLGADWQKADWNGIRAAMEDPASIDIFAPVHGGYVPVTRSERLSRGLNRQTGLYLQDQISLGNWRFTLGGRHDRTDDLSASARRGAAGGQVSSWSETRPSHSAFSKNAGLLYAGESGWSPYLSYSESFQPSTVGIEMSYDRTPFSPITGRQVEGGVKFQPARFDGLITLSAYDLRQQNILTNDPDPTHGNICGSNGNVTCRIQSGEGRVRGIELEARVTPLDGLSIIGAAARMKSEVTRDSAGYQGKQLAGVPDWTAALWADYTFHEGALNGLSIAAGARYNGQIYGDSANLHAIPAYLLWDGALRYDLGHNGSFASQLALNVSNLTDKVYVSTCGGFTSCHYGTGRTVSASLRLVW
ncbi:TonB-dependent siderophore receptor [Lysobacter pythonis]|uniref:TonB-dependent siderophore receptor n=1 Tax=Solilutibacter pythonis TaxID=2483112 RepID=A0A3M2HKA9_9GAMM|nr:TonB-dependent siderophore receptor [Lysobacter pythonis]RMH89458.1 TonB-dependent siderophore receptor [Lysobacter pythonis]